MKRILLIVLSCLCSFCTAPLYAAQEDSLWSAVTAGETLCEPLIHDNHIYTVTSDYAVNCVDEKGSFVWRRTIQKVSKPFFSMSDSGMLLVTDLSGKLQAISSQGIALWSIRLRIVPLYAPHITRSGRIFVLTSSALYCLSMRGTVKWQLPLPAPPSNILGETGDSSVLLVLSNKECLTLSVNGELRDRQALKKNITALAPADSGYLISTSDGLLSYYKEHSGGAAGTAGSIALWQSKEKQPPIYIDIIEGKLLCITADGIVSLRNVQTNTVLWTASLNTAVSLPLHCTKTRREYRISSKGFAAVLSDEGIIKWQKKTSKTAFMPLITANNILILVDGWVMSGYRMETKIIRRSLPEPETEPEAPRISSFYHRIKQYKQHRTIPFFIPDGNAADMLIRIEKDIIHGTVGSREADYAVLLAIILTNTEKLAYFPYDFNIHDRAHAAELLGQLESLEYREVLLEEAKKTREPMLAVSIISALGSIACDPDGKSLISIELLLNRYGTKERDIPVAACEALAEIAKYGDKIISHAALKILFSIYRGPFSENIKQYARQKIQTIVE